MEIPADWSFRSHEVADAFDAHVREQLPWYDLASGAVAHVARHYLPENGLVYDIGASTGNIGALLAPSIEARGARLVSIEESREMVDAWHGHGEVVHADALTYSFEPYDVAVLFLVVMFLPVPERRDFLDHLWRRCRPGGALLIVDKLDPSSGYLATVMRRLTLAGKVATGTPAQQIIEKELSLAGAQRPIEVEDLPGEPEMFFRFGEFAGWVIEGPRR